MKKSWKEKRGLDKKLQVKITKKQFAGVRAGAKLLIPTPKVVDELVKKIPEGSFLYSKQIGEKLAQNFNAEATFQEYQNHKDINMITPFWRIVEPDSKLARKLACGIDFIIDKQIQEGIEL
tara:strand:- start:26 stop:388 length:363 start_codon:yes stop_codon:yes gene_type:complete